MFISVSRFRTQYLLCSQLSFEKFMLIHSNWIWVGFGNSNLKCIDSLVHLNQKNLITFRIGNRLEIWWQWFDVTVKLSLKLSLVSFDSNWWTNVFGYPNDWFVKNWKIGWRITHIQAHTFGKGDRKAMDSEVSSVKKNMKIRRNALRHQYTIQYMGKSVYENVLMASVQIQIGMRTVHTRNISHSVRASGRRYF